MSESSTLELDCWTALMFDVPWNDLGMKNGLP